MFIDDQRNLVVQDSYQNELYNSDTATAETITDWTIKTVLYAGETLYVGD